MLLSNVEAGTELNPFRNPGNWQEKGEPEGGEGSLEGYQQQHPPQQQTTSFMGGDNDYEGNYQQTDGFRYRTFTVPNPSTERLAENIALWVF